jgi:hypothetical protein
VQWTGGYAPRFQAFFSTLGFFRFDSESQPTHLPLTRVVNCHDIRYTFSRLESSKIRRILAISAGLNM